MNESIPGLSVPSWSHEIQPDQLVTMKEGCSERGKVVAAIVTHRRPVELKRLLDGLAASSAPLLGCVIADHAPGGETPALARASSLQTLVIDDASNPGPGAGWANAARKAFEVFGDQADAIWFLDDDVAIPPDSLEILWKEMSRVHADAIAPLLEDGKGRLWAFPEPEPAPLRRSIRRVSTPSEARQALGEEPIPFCWCTGACFLVRTEAIQRAGYHRADFWLLGEDLEYSMRIASHGRAVFTCKVSVPHLPPEAAATPRAGYAKFCSLLQNLSYLSFHAPHSSHMKRYLAGNFRRFFRTFGLSPSTMRHAITCLWNGAVLAQPSGASSGQALRRHILKA